MQGDLGSRQKHKIADILLPALSLRNANMRENRLPSWLGFAGEGRASREVFRWIGLSAKDKAANAEP